MSDVDPDLPNNPERVRAFARFFKNYMSISSLVVASLPIPVTAMKLIPTYKGQTTILSVYTPLFCFLTLGFIFYIRHFLAKAMFPDVLESFVPPEEPPEPDWESAGDADKRNYERAVDRYRYELMKNRLRKRRIILRRFVVYALPFICIIASLLSVYAYHVQLGASAQEVRRTQQIKVQTDASEKKSTNFKDILDSTEIDEIPNGTFLILLYVSIFVTAEAAFILMAIKEYIQDLMGYKERELIIKSYR
jgi:hypothetical protein